MKMNSKHILFSLMLLLSLTSCEKYIEYNGPEEPELLVLNCEFRADGDHNPCVYLNHSFFMGRGAVDTVMGKYFYTIYDEQTQQDDTVWYESPTVAAQSGLVTDASVEIKCNDGEWIAMPYDPYTYAYHLMYSEGIFPGDKLQLRASHTKYGEISTQQTVPQYVNATATYRSIDNNGLAHITLHLPAYTGDPSDVLAIEVYGTLAYSSYWNGQVYSNDTVDLAAVYSLDQVFAQLSNPQSAAGYYGADHHGKIYLPASAFMEPRDVDLYIDREYDGYTNVEQTEFQVLDMTLRLSAVTLDYYRYKATLSAAAEDNYVRDPYGKEVEKDYDMQEYLDLVAEVLGAQEPVQIYTNIQGGLGHFATLVSRDLKVL